MKPRVVLLGSGGHARVILEILEERSEFEVVGCVSNESAHKHILGYPILGNDSVLPELFESGVLNGFVAVGDNRIRQALGHQLIQHGYTMINVISARAVVSPRSVIGRGVAIMPGAFVIGGTIIGDGSIVNTGAVVDHDCAINQYAHIAPGATLAGSVKIGEGTLIGVGSSVLPDVDIGPWVTVGAGAAVIRNLPGHVTAVGVPAVIRN